MSERPTREIRVGVGGRLPLAGGLLTGLSDRIDASLFDGRARGDRHAPRGPGNVQDPQADGNRVHGDAGEAAMKTSLATWTRLHPGATIGAALAVGVGAATALRR